ncbi:MAG: hypothetical protein ACK5RT_00280 [Dolichospermum sp.]|jgi:hypothetical protein
MNIYTKLKEKINLLGAIFDKLISIQSRLIKIQETLGRIESRQLQSLDKLELQDNEFQVFSQWGEDGIIQMLLRHIEIPNKIFIEFGVENYTESNTRFLLINDNWAGLVIDGLSILPNHNLVSNIGFREDGTHTTSQDSKLSNLPTVDIWEIKHPPFVVRHKEADLYTFDNIFGGKHLKNADTLKGTFISFFAKNKQRFFRLFSDPIGVYYSLIKKIFKKSSIY